MLKATGIGRYISNLIRELSILDRENSYFLFFKKEDYDLFKEPGKNFKKVLAPYHWYGLQEQLKLPGILKKYKLDLVHFPHFNVPLLYKGKYVITIHDLTLHQYKTVRASTKSFLTYQIKHSLYKTVIRKAIAKASKILTPSSFTKEDIITYFSAPQDKIMVTYEGGPSGEMSRKAPDKNIFKKLNLKSPFILYVGNAYPHKNLNALVESLKYLSSRVRLVFVGKIDEFYKRLKEDVSRLKFQKRVIFAGYIKDEELVSLYKNASLFVFPSLNEGFGLPALEAQSFGLPVSCSRRSSLPEILGDSARYFNPLKPKDIAEKIKEILGNKKLREELILKGYNKIKKYSWSKMAKETLKVYEETGK